MGNCSDAVADQPKETKQIQDTLNLKARTQIEKQKPPQTNERQINFTEGKQKQLQQITTFTQKRIDTKNKPQKNTTYNEIKQQNIPHQSKVTQIKQSSQNIQKLSRQSTLDIHSYKEALKKQSIKSLDPQVILKVTQLFKNSSLLNNITSIFKDLCYTQQSFNRISKDLLRLLNGLNTTISQQQRSQIKQFIKNNQSQISEGKLFFQDLLQAKQIHKNQYPQSSALFYEFFNIISNRLQKFESNTKQKKPASIDELIKLQTVEAYTESFTESFSFIYQSLKEETSQIQKVLQMCSLNYQCQISELKYDLEEKQVNTIAMISRDSCNYHQDGIFILLIYFVKAIRKLRISGQSLVQIESKLEKMLKIISDKYPPGEKLKGEDDVLKVIDQVNKKQEFKTDFITLDPSKKREQLSEIILGNAKLAKSKRKDFQHLVRNTCFLRCISFKTGLKLNPDNPNNKAIMRIQQKMFFKNKTVQRSTQKEVDSVLQDQDQIYQQTIQKQLEQLKEVKFTISDMVRGKCVFSNLQDILDTVHDIKKFVQEENAVTPNKYRITQIESRFNRQPPISDVTLKIALNQQLVSQLQLTIQDNIAAYNFAHKIYEFNRSKLFSKIKIIHNYYEQYQEELDQMLKRMLKIQKDNKYSLIDKNCEMIANFFQLHDQQNQISLSRSLSNLVQGKQHFAKLRIQNKMQSLINAVFYRKMGQLQLISKYKEQCMSKQFSVEYQDTVSLQFFKGTNMCQQFHKIRQISTEYDKYLKKNYSLIIGRCSPKTFIEYFRLYQQMHVGSNGQHFHRIYANFMKQIYGEYSLQLIQHLMELGILRQYYEVDSLFQTKYQSYKFFQIALQTAKKKKSLKNDSAIMLLIPKLELLLAQSYIKTDKYNEAKELLSNNYLKFKQNNKPDDVVICSLLLAQCELKLNKQVSQFKKKYNSTIQYAKANGILVKGPHVAQSKWRIGNILKQIKDYQIQAYDKYYRQAMDEFSVYLYDRTFYRKMIQICPIIIKLDLRKLQFKRESIKIKNDNNFGNRGCQFLNKSQWPYLKLIEIWDQNINYSGFKELAKIQAPHLSDFSINDITLTSECYKYISKANWPQLNKFCLQTVFNKSVQGKEKGCRFLLQANWPNLIQFKLKDKIGKKDCQYLCKANWPKLKKLNLFMNNITQQCCEDLVKGNWPQLMVLNLDNNSIGIEGCKHLIKGHWLNLITLCISDNKIGDQACQHLNKGQWPLLKDLQIKQNLIQSKGCEQLSKGKWPDLENLRLDNSRVKKEIKDQMKQMFKCSFPKLRLIIL